MREKVPPKTKKGVHRKVEGKHYNGGKDYDGYGAKTGYKNEKRVLQL